MELSEENLIALKRSKLLAELNEAQIVTALSCLNGHIKTFTKDSAIFLEGSKADFMGIILNGEVQTLKTDYRGNFNIIAKLFSSDLIAAVAAFSGSKCLPFDVVCVADCDIMVLDADKLIRPCAKGCPFHTKIISNMLKVIADKNVQLVSKIDILSKRTIKDKVLAFLHSHALRAGSNHFCINMTRRQMAEFLSVNRSALSRELGFMCDEGIIEFSTNKFTLKTL